MWAAEFLQILRLRRRRIYQASDTAKLWLEFLSVLELIACIACAVRNCENKCGERQSPEMFSFLIRGFPRRFTPLNDTRGRFLPPHCRLSNGAYVTCEKIVSDEVVRSHSRFDKVDGVNALLLQRPIRPIRRCGGNAVYLFDALDNFAEGGVLPVKEFGVGVTDEELR